MQIRKYIEGNTDEVQLNLWGITLLQSMNGHNQILSTFIILILILHCTNMVAIMDSTCVTVTIVTVPFKMAFWYLTLSVKVATLNNNCTVESVLYKAIINCDLSLENLPSCHIWYFEKYRF